MRNWSVKQTAWWPNFADSLVMTMTMMKTGVGCSLISLYCTIRHRNEEATSCVVLRGDAWRPKQPSSRLRRLHTDDHRVVLMLTLSTAGRTADLKAAAAAAAAATAAGDPENVWLLVGRRPTDNLAALHIRLAVRDCDRSNLWTLVGWVATARIAASRSVVDAEEYRSQRRRSQSLIFIRSVSQFCVVTLAFWLLDDKKRKRITHFAESACSVFAVR